MADVRLGSKYASDFEYNREIKRHSGNIAIKNVFPRHSFTFGAVNRDKILNHLKLP